MAEQGVDLSKEHGRPHAIKLGAYDRPMPRGSMRGAEHPAVLGDIAWFNRELPRGIIPFHGKVTMPCRRIRIIR